MGLGSPGAGQDLARGVHPLIQMLGSSAANIDQDQGLGNFPPPAELDSQMANLQAGRDGDLGDGLSVLAMMMAAGGGGGMASNVNSPSLVSGGTLGGRNIALGSGGSLG